ncbi:MAG: PAS domain S-box protein [Desulfovibrio sp.]|nr:PAS domain S-box protein [Desulfovibrio sp.]
MGLRRATILLIGLTLAVLLLGLYTASRYIILDRFETLEEDIARQNVERGVNALYSRISQLGLLASDWANWDDAYAFMLDHNEAFVTSNLVSETFVHQGLNIILFVDMDGMLVWGRLWDSESDRLVPLPESALQVLLSGTARLFESADRTAKNGIMMLPQGPFLVAMHPVLKSDHTGTPRGILFMGALFGGTETAKIADVTRLDLSIRPVSAVAFPASVMKNDFADRVILVPQDESILTGYALVRDIFDKPALIVSVAMPRDIYRRGVDMMHYNLTTIFLAGLGFAVVVLLFLERRVISRVGLMERQSCTIGTRHEAGKRVALSGRDELARLSDSINDMLDRLEKTQEALEISENKYRSLFLNTATAMLLVNTETSIIELVNAEFERLSGYPRGEVEHRKSWKEFTLESDALAIEEFFRRRAAADGQFPGTIDCRFIGRAREILFVSLTVAMIKGTDSCIVSMIDLTDRKRAEEALAEFNRTLEQLVAERTGALAEKAHELEEANQRLLELDRLKSAFLSSVSHELRTPLTSIRGFAKLILKDLSRMTGMGQGLSGKYKRVDDNLHIIITESDRLTMLLNDFLDLSKIESGRMEWRDARLSVSDLIVRAVGAVRALFDEKPGICLSLDVPEGLPDLFVDPDRMLQVLINLLSNAAKFTDKGLVRVVAVPDDDGLRLTVSDEGVGVPEADMETIFRKFRQSTQGDILENKPKGTGLGLAICRNIVQHYGGRIWVESTLGKGSSFHVRLPREALVQKDKKKAAPSGDEAA